MDAIFELRPDSALGSRLRAALFAALCARGASCKPCDAPEKASVRFEGSVGTMCGLGADGSGTQPLPAASFGSGFWARQDGRLREACLRREPCQDHGRHPPVCMMFILPPPEKPSIRQSASERKEGWQAGPTMRTDVQQKRLEMKPFQAFYKSSGRLDSNQRPPTPEAGALTGLRYTPNCCALIT